MSIINTIFFVAFAIDLNRCVCLHSYLHIYFQLLILIKLCRNLQVIFICFILFVVVILFFCNFLLLLHFLLGFYATFSVPKKKSEISIIYLLNFFFCFNFDRWLIVKLWVKKIKTIKANMVAMRTRKEINDRDKVKKTQSMDAFVGCDRHRRWSHVCVCVCEKKTKTTLFSTHNISLFLFTKILCLCSMWKFHTQLFPSLCREVKKKSNLNRYPLSIIFDKKFLQLKSCLKTRTHAFRRDCLSPFYLIWTFALALLCVFLVFSFQKWFFFSQFFLYEMIRENKKKLFRIL